MLTSRCVSDAQRAGCVTFVNTALSCPGLDLTGRNCELLMQYLLAPYLRIPLVVQARLALLPASPRLATPSSSQFPQYLLERACQPSLPPLPFQFHGTCSSVRSVPGVRKHGCSKQLRAAAGKARACFVYHAALSLFLFLSPQFFADQMRVTALGSEELQSVMDAVFFEPGPALPQPLFASQFVPRALLKRHGPIPGHAIAAVEHLRCTLRAGCGPRREEKGAPEIGGRNDSCRLWQEVRSKALPETIPPADHAREHMARPSLIPSLCTHFTRAGIEWRR